MDLTKEDKELIKKARSFVNNKIKVKGFRVIETSISDHLPLILDFEVI